jgi:hypothetical protein
MIVTTRQIADLFDVTDRAVRKWSERGCPRAGHGKWDMKAVLTWWLENCYAGNDTEGILEAKESYWKAKARTETVKADLAEGATMPVDELKKAWAWRVSEIFRGIMGWSMRLAPLLAGKTDKEIQSIVYSEAWSLCDRFSRTGKWTPAVKKPKKKKFNKNINGKGN